MLFKDVVALLEQALSRELPGAAAHEHLAPVPRRQWPAGFSPAHIRHAAGLLLVFPKTINAAAFAPEALRRASPELEHSVVERRREPAESAEQSKILRVPRVPPVTSDQAHILLTVRADTLGRHGGQVSLPGGVVDPHETYEQAALREAHEEVGLAQDQVRVLGALTPLDIPVSGFRLHPIVGASETEPHLTPADDEVARILDIDVDTLLARDCLIHTARERDGVAFTIPGFHVDGVEIWGATAMVLAEFLSVLGWTASKSV
jgi:8-oxo-dGTP pyrophosphatase MutT (NUDIX family)